MDLGLENARLVVRLARVRDAAYTTLVRQGLQAARNQVRRQIVAAILGSEIGEIVTRLSLSQLAEVCDAVEETMLRNLLATTANKPGGT